MSPVRTLSAMAVECFKDKGILNQNFFEKFLVGTENTPESPPVYLGFSSGSLLGSTPFLFMKTQNQLIWHGMSKGNFMTLLLKEIVLVCVLLSNLSESLLFFESFIFELLSIIVLLIKISKSSRFLKIIEYVQQTQYSLQRFYSLFLMYILFLKHIKEKMERSQLPFCDPRTAQILKLVAQAQLSAPKDLKKAIELLEKAQKILGKDQRYNVSKRSQRKNKSEAVYYSKLTNIYNRVDYYSKSIIINENFVEKDKNNTLFTKRMGDSSHQNQNCDDTLNQFKQRKAPRQKPLKQSSSFQLIAYMKNKQAIEKQYEKTIKLHQEAPSKTKNPFLYSQQQDTEFQQGNLSQMMEDFDQTQITQDQENPKANNQSDNFIFRGFQCLSNICSVFITKNNNKASRIKKQHKVIEEADKISFQITTEQSSSLGQKYQGQLFLWDLPSHISGFQIFINRIAEGDQGENLSGLFVVAAKKISKPFKFKVPLSPKCSSGIALSIRTKTQTSENIAQLNKFVFGQEDILPMVIEDNFMAHVFSHLIKESGMSTGLKASWSQIESYLKSQSIVVNILIDLVKKMLHFGFFWPQAVMDGIPQQITLKNSMVGLSLDFNQTYKQKNHSIKIGGQGEFQNEKGKNKVYLELGRSTKQIRLELEASFSIITNLLSIMGIRIPPRIDTFGKEIILNLEWIADPEQKIADSMKKQMMKPFFI